MTQQQVGKVCCLEGERVSHLWLESCTIGGKHLEGKAEKLWLEQEWDRESCNWGKP